MRVNAKDLLMRGPVKSGKDWFRIENKKKDDEVVETDVYIYDEIGFWGTSSSDFVNQLAAIATPQINLHLNSPGGEIFDGIAIYNALKGHSAKVTVYVDALAASAASFIAQAGDEVKIARNATMMIHDGIALTYGNAKDHTDTASLLDKLSDNIADIYSQRAGDDVETWRNLMREEVWYNSAEAVEAGLADEVIEVEPVAENSAGFTLLNIFEHTGRDNAPSPESIRQRVFNRVKEARMAQPHNEDGTQSEGVNPEGAPEQEETEANSPDGSQPGESGTVPEVPVPAAPVAPAPPVENRAQFSVLINGVATGDVTAIQNHINVLEGALKETREANRKAFVENLAQSGRIAAPQLKAMTDFALELNDKQYESWVASWDAAPSLQLLGDHAATGQYGAGTAPSARAENDNLETSKAIVRQHKLGGMPIDKIKETPSYKAIVAHDPQFEL